MIMIIVISHHFRKVWMIFYRVRYNSILQRYRLPGNILQLKWHDGSQLNDVQMLEIAKCYVKKNMIFKGISVLKQIIQRNLSFHCKKIWCNNEKYEILISFFIVKFYTIIKNGIIDWFSFFISAIIILIYYYCC